MKRLSSSAAPPLDPRDSLVRRAAETRGLISFAGGLPDPTLFPKRQLAQALIAALQADPAGALQYGWPEGSLELRQHIARQLAARGAKVEPERIIVTSGAQQAIQIAISLLGERPRIAVERESYPGALDLFRNARARLLALEDEAQLYYVMPAISNPHGQIMSADARHALLERAQRGRGYVIEDDAYAGTEFSGQSETPLLASHPERVFHVGTYSKTLCPGLRIGWLVPPRKLAKQALKQKQAIDLQANGLSQALLVEYLRTSDYERLQRRARSRYQRKLRRLLKAVKQQLPQLSFHPPSGGFSLWLESELQLDDSRLLEIGIEQGVSFDLGQQFRTAPNHRLAIRLCFSAVAEDDIERGVARIAKALKKAAR